MKHYKRKRLNIVNGSLAGLKTLILVFLSIWIIGDWPLAGWAQPQTTIIVFPDQEWVESNNWPVGAEVTLTIDDPSTGPGVDYEATQTVTESGFRFEVEDDGFDIQPGHIVMVTDGVTTKEHIVTSLEVRSVDQDSDTVSGWTNEPFSEIDICVHETSYCLTVFADEFENWSADLSGLVDIVPGTAGGAHECEWDEDWDTTVVFWRAPLNEPPIALCKDIEISVDENCESYIVPGDIDGGSYDPDGDFITLSVDNLGPFSLGEHTVNLTVTDEKEASDTCQAKVTVVDTTAPIITKTEELIQGIQNSGIQQEIVDSLAEKLENAISSLENGNVTAAINQIQAFQNQVEAQSGKKISEELAEEWIATLEDIIQDLEDL